jgi:hypothetical protein
MFVWTVRPQNSRTCGVGDQPLHEDLGGGHLGTAGRCRSRSRSTPLDRWPAGRPGDSASIGS